MTLLQCIDKLLENITITDKQTEQVSTTYKNIKSLLLDSESGLNGERVFQNGSYDRDTIIKPLDDIDIFFVLKKENYVDNYGTLPDPQSVLTKIKDYLNGTKDYKDKAKQDRPCITIHLSDKKFDILPCFGNDDEGYLIPNHDLTGWIYSNPVKHSEALTKANDKNNKVVPTVRIIKYWNKENKKLIPSFHIEEIAISIFETTSFTNFEESVYHWFDKVLLYMRSDKFSNTTDYDEAKKKVERDKNKIAEAHKLYIDGKEGEAIKKWKDVFGDKFPTISEEEAKAMNELMKSGNLKMDSKGALSVAGSIVVQPTKFFGDKK